MTVTAKILCKVGDQKPKGIKKAKDGDKVDVIQDINGQRTTIATGIVKIEVEQPPPIDAPLKVSAGEDRTVKEGQNVILDGSAIDEDNTIVRAEWKQAQGQAVTLAVDPNDKTNVSFTAPQLLGTEPEIFLFNFEAENDKSEIKEDQVQITVTKDGTEPPPPPTGKNTYGSNKDGKWSNGHKRTFTNFDPDLPKPYKNGKGIMMAASGNPRGEVDGQGTFILTVDGQGTSKEGHGRAYIDSINFNSFTEYDLRFDDDIVSNHTQQNQSRHQQGDDKNYNAQNPEFNRFGGTNHMIDRKNKKVGLKIEKFHNVHDNGPEENMTGDIPVGKWVRVKNIDAVNVAKKEIHLESWIDFMDGKGYVKQVEWTRTNCPDYYIDEATFMLVSYMWFRINTPATGRISIRNVSNNPL